MKIGYLRVSTEEQKPDRQIDALEPLCDELHIEKISATAQRRPVFEKTLARLVEGDCLVVWDLDRAFRSTIDALLTEQELRARGVSLKIVTLQVNTLEPAGAFFYSVMAAAAQFEKQMLSKRTKEGLAAARRRGKKLGRPRKLKQCELLAAQNRLNANEVTLAELASDLGVSPSTVSRSLQRIKAS